MGETLMWNSFTTRGDANTPVGKINYGSFAARNWLSNFRTAIDENVSNFGPLSARAYYAANAGGR